MKSGPRINWHRPLAIHPRALEEDLTPRSAVSDRGFTEVGDTAIVEIRGPLMQRADGFWSFFCDDYDSIHARVAAALGSGAQRVIMRIDSPGGDASGCLELARELRTMARASGKKLVAFGEGMVASAAYAIASAADEIVCTPTTLAGSVGCIAMLVDVTGMDRAAGVAVTLVASGERKADGNPHAPVTDEVRARVQSMIDELAGLFFAVVVEHRGANIEALQELGGGMLVAGTAAGDVRARLIDRVGTWSEVLANKPASEAPPMADKKDYKGSAKEALRAIVDDEKASAEDREQARKALRALEAEPDQKDDKKDEPKSEEDEPKDGEKKDEMRSAAGVSPVDVAAVARDAALQAVREERRAQADATKIQELLAQRPDFDASMRATLAKLPVADVEAAVKDWPRRSTFAPAAAANAHPTVQGETQGDRDHGLTAQEKELLDRHMAHTGDTAPTSLAESPSATFDVKGARKRAATLGKESP